MGKITDYLFWDDSTMYRNRLKEIYEMLDELDLERPDSFKITEQLFLMPSEKTNFHSEDEIENLYKKKPELFFGKNRLYGVRSSSEDLMLGNGRTIYSFSRDSFQIATLYSDYFTQCVLLILYDWSREKAKKARND